MYGHRLRSWALGKMADPFSTGNTKQSWPASGKTGTARTDARLGSMARPPTGRVEIHTQLAGSNPASRTPGVFGWVLSVSRIRTKAPARVLSHGDTRSDRGASPLLLPVVSRIRLECQIQPGPPSN